MNTGFFENCLRSSQLINAALRKFIFFGMKSENTLIRFWTVERTGFDAVFNLVSLLTG